MTVTIDITTDQISTALGRVAAALTDPTPMFQDLGEYLIKSTKDRFPTGKAPDGSIWAPKSATTLEAYGARKTNRMDTRPLFGPSKMLSQQIFYQAYPDRVAWGSPMVYAAMMQFGGTRSAFPHLWGNIPARPFLGLSAEDQPAILGIIADYLEEAAAGGA